MNHAKELQKMGQDLGYTGVSQKYFLGHLTQYCGELAKVTWQVEGGCKEVNTSLKSYVVALGQKTLDGVNQLKILREEEATRHAELLTALGSMESALSSVASMMIAAGGPQTANVSGPPAPTTNVGAPQAGR